MQEGSAGREHGLRTRNGRRPEAAPVLIDPSGAMERDDQARRRAQASSASSAVSSAGASAATSPPSSAKYSSQASWPSEYAGPM
jgi:hypothetical protein